MKPAFVLLCSAMALAQSWVPRTSNTTASLRGISVASTSSAWAGGTGGTYLKTTDGGRTWTAAQVPGAERLDFRDVQAVDGRTAYLMTIGPGDQSRIYKTSDGGRQWRLRLPNPDSKGFFDAFAFWDATHGILVGDPVDGLFVVYTTDDGGEHWRRRAGATAKPAEGAFAASGTCIAVAGPREAWFGTGGPEGARVFHSTDGGATFSETETPIRNDAASAGIFSLAFADALHGVAVGGDYSKPEDGERNVAITSDGGRTWTAPPGHAPAGFRSAVAYLPASHTWVAAGTSGSDISTDGGRTWSQFDKSDYNAVGFLASGFGFAVGPKGRLAQFSPR